MNLYFYLIKNFKKIISKKIYYYQILKKSKKL